LGVLVADRCKYRHRIRLAFACRVDGHWDEAAVAFVPCGANARGMAGNRLPRQPLFVNVGSPTTGSSPVCGRVIVHLRGFQLQPPLDLEELLLEDWRKMKGERKESRSQALGRVVADLAVGISDPGTPTYR
jgi:hypothetical protein